MNRKTLIGLNRFGSRRSAIIAAVSVGRKIMADKTERAETAPRRAAEHAPITERRTSAGNLSCPAIRRTRRIIF